MGKTLTFEMPDEVYDVLQAEAARSGRAFEAIALDWLAKYRLNPLIEMSAEERAAARARLERHFGAVSSGDPHSGDNERIDADLAREYGRTE